MTAPTTPNSMVTMQPPGSLPGMINFAMAPATNPRTIQPRKPMISTPSIAPRISVILFRTPCTQCHTAACSHDLDGPAALATLRSNGWLGLGDIGARTIGSDARTSSICMWTGQARSRYIEERLGAPRGDCLLGEGADIKRYESTVEYCLIGFSMSTQPPVPVATWSTSSVTTAGPAIG